MVQNSHRRRNNFVHKVINAFSANKSRQKDEKNTEESHNKSIRWTNWIIACSTIGVLLATAYQAWLNHKQLGIISQQMTDTKDQMTLFRKQVSYDSIQATSFKTSVKSDSIMAIATKNSVDISENSLDVNKLNAAFNEKSFQIQNRAFLTFVEIANDYVFKAGSELRLKVKIQNIGHTPAYERSCTTIIIGDSVYFRKLMDTVIEKRELDSIANKGIKMVIGGNMISYIELGNNKGFIDKETYDGIKNGTWNIYIIGDIIYDDFFRKHHFLHFCGFVDMETMMFSPVGYYNDTDKQ